MLLLLCESLVAALLEVSVFHLPCNYIYFLVVIRVNWLSTLSVLFSELVHCLSAELYRCFAQLKKSWIELRQLKIFLTL